MSPEVSVPILSRGTKIVLVFHPNEGTETVDSDEVSPDRVRKLPVFRPL